MVGNTYVAEAKNMSVAQCMHYFQASSVGLCLIEWIHTKNSSIYPKSGGLEG